MKVRATLGVCKNDINLFLHRAENILEDKGYNVYFTEVKYTYCGVRKQVEDNEMIIAIK